MDDALTDKQVKAFWALLAAGGQGKMPGNLSKPEELIHKGLIQKGYKVGRKAALAEVTGRGWDWAHEHLGSPKATPSALHPWFAVLKAFLDDRDMQLNELFVSYPEPLSPKPVTRPKPPTATQLRQRIEAAYLGITDGAKNRSVPLSALRAALSDLDRATVDKGLARILKRDRKARLSQISDFRAISEAERAAAFSPAGEPFHLLWIHA